MPLASGFKFGQYDIVSMLGAGGMGEVYRARDTRLQREVAIKVLPEGFDDSPDRITRFTREAQVLASLNHPAIASIYGIEEGPAKAGHYVHGLVMELVEGPTLADRLVAGPLPIDEVLSVAKQIVEGLEAAHEQGIIHRDLKPANVKVRADGAVKILDFGLAKALDPAAAAGSRGSAVALTHSPTLAPMTMTGAMIIGTAPYMAPEQARGRTVDRRVDIWAFGCVLFEMLTGERAFPGDDVTDVLAKIIEREPNWSSLPATTPSRVRELLRRTLDKDPKTRLRDIGEARMALTRGPDEESPRVEAQPLRRVHRLGWVVAGVVTIALAVSLFALWRARTPIAHQVERYDVAGPSGSTLSLVGQSSVTIAPDGRTIVFAASTDGIVRLYVRHRDEVELRAIAGSEGASSPVFSPDGQWVAFVSGTELKKTTLDGPPVTLAKVADHRGIAWLDNQTIVFAPFAAGGLSRISASGGEPQRLTRVDSAKGERTHRWPAVLPGGAAVLFTVGTYGSPDSYENSRIDAFIMATGERRTVFEGASVVRYLPGRLVFSRGGLLYAVAFDAASLAVSGTPTTIARGVGGDVTTGAVHFAVSEDGTLVYIPDDSGGGVRRRVTWVGPTGAAEPLSLPPNAYNDLRISPDDSRMAVVVGASGSGDIWIHDFRRATFTRLTFDTVNASPIWSKDGQYVYFAAIDASGLKTTIKRRRADGGRDAETIGAVDSRLYLRGLTSDETAIFADDFTRESDVGGKRAEVALVSLTPSVKERIIVSTPGDDFESSLAPNGRWFAYSSDESGRAEIYVRDLSNDGGRWQVSTTGGQEPRWSSDSRTLYYRFENRLISAAVTGTTTFGVDTPRTLFSGIYNLQSATNMTFDIEHSGHRFLMVRPDAEKAAPPTTLRLVLNGLNAGQPR
jgi:eukaryotic-like serine/threonine-protein kinase